MAWVKFCEGLREHTQEVERGSATTALPKAGREQENRTFNLKHLPRGHWKWLLVFL